MREKAASEKGKVKLLRQMLVWEAKDKEYLSKLLNQVTKGRKFFLWKKIISNGIF